MVFLVIAIVAAALVVAAIVMYNNLVKQRNRVDNAWSQIDVQMQRRLDLIPNLVETVKGYAAHESATLEGVTAARTAVTNASNAHDKMAADDALTACSGAVSAVSEAYSDLKANVSSSSSRPEPLSTEDKISYMRQSYNDTVMKYNTAIQTFPAGLLRDRSASKSAKASTPRSTRGVAPDVKSRRIDFSLVSNVSPRRSARAAFFFVGRRSHHAKREQCSLFGIYAGKHLFFLRIRRAFRGVFPSCGRPIFA